MIDDEFKKREIQKYDTKSRIPLLGQDVYGLIGKHLAGLKNARTLMSYSKVCVTFWQVTKTQRLHLLPLRNFYEALRPTEKNWIAIKFYDDAASKIGLGRSVYPRLGKFIADLIMSARTPMAVIDCLNSILANFLAENFSSKHLSSSHFVVCLIEALSPFLPNTVPFNNKIEKLSLEERKCYLTKIQELTQSINPEPKEPAHSELKRIMDGKISNSVVVDDLRNLLMFYQGNNQEKSAKTSIESTRCILN